MKGGAQTGADGQGEDAGGLSVACAVNGLGGGDSVGVVHHGKSAAVKMRQALFDVNADPCLA